MEIDQTKTGDLLTLRLNGRLDATWCGTVEAALSAAVRAGEHRMHVDMAQVNYMSSMGIRVLLAVFRQLRAINGLFGVVHPSPTVRSMLELAGMAMLITEAAPESKENTEEGAEEHSEHAAYRIYAIPAKTPGMQVEACGEAAWLSGKHLPETLEKRVFTEDTIAVGIGGLGSDYADCAPRLGEFLAAAGIAAYQPGEESSRPDYVVSEEALVPEGYLFLGLAGAGEFSSLVRFECEGERGTTPFSELARNALRFSNTNAAVIVAVTETAGLIGAFLRKSPASPSSAEERFEFPQIRDWLSFTSERSYRDTTSLIVGVVATDPALFPALLRPLGNNLYGHVHAASFPYHPLQKGRIEMKPTVSGLFDGQNLQAVLHLLADPREINGAGESEFLRGAIWVAPLTNPKPSQS